MSEPFRVLSLGAGLDSTTLLLMSEHGDLPRLDCAIFADTQAEPRHVYETLGWLTARVTIPLYRVTAGNLATSLLAPEPGQRHGGHTHPPFFIANQQGEQAMLRRKCTQEYKIVPITRKIRELVGLKPKGGIPKGVHVEQWIGFTKDDLGRTFCSGKQWITNVFPLILPKQMSRADCRRWLEVHGYPIPEKSSCIFCPYHRDTYWRQMRTERPNEWAQAVAFEQQLQRTPIPGVNGMPYLHRSLVTLDMAPIDGHETGQQELSCMMCNT